jgi:hypothetical protein
MANFIFARKAGLDGAKWYERLKEKGVPMDCDGQFWAQFALHYICKWIE